jgi:hypothetical protein
MRWRGAGRRRRRGSAVRSRVPAGVGRGKSGVGPTGRGLVDLGGLKLKFGGLVK